MKRTIISAVAMRGIKGDKGDKGDGTNTRYALGLPIPAIALGGPASIISVTWDKPFDDASYMAIAFPTATAALVGKLGAPVLIEKTATGCKFAISSTILLSANTAKLDVFAWKP